MTTPVLKLTCYSISFCEQKQWLQMNLLPFTILVTWYSSTLCIWSFYLFFAAIWIIQKIIMSSQDECYQVRQVFAQKLHKGLSRLRLPLEYMAICALCAKDPVKERRAHARQCLVKNINVRREYLKQHAAVSGKHIWKSKYTSTACRLHFYRTQNGVTIICYILIGTH